MTVQPAIRSAAVPVSRPRGRRRRPSNWAAWILVAPVLVLFLCTRIIPALWAFYLSFTDYRLLTSPEWIGLGNYRELLHSELFRKSLTNTLVYAGSVTVGSTALGLALAVGLNKVRLLKRFLRTAYFLPVVVSAVATASVWSYILNPQAGWLNYIISVVGMDAQSWLSNPTLAMPSIIAIGIWQNVGYAVLIYLAGLQGIPSSVEEAALMDGANGWRLFRHVTWPLLSPTTSVVVLLVTITSLQVFDQIIVLTNGGPVNATTTVIHQTYLNAFQYLRMGYASAMAFVFFVVILGVSIVALRANRRDFEY